MDSFPAAESGGRPTFVLLPLGCPMTIYGGLDDHEVDAERLAAWGEMTVGACEIRMFPGGHFYLNNSRAVFWQTFAGDLLLLRPQN
jgi:medium-chain acyl-[acyl-carrier-protein] hydrolase